MSQSILGFDVGGSKISAVLGDESGNILANVRRPTIKHLGKKRLVEQLDEMGHEVMKVAGTDRIDSIGILFAGLVDRDKGVVLSSPNILGLNNFNITGEIGSRFNVPVYLENDATGATIAERIFGAGKDMDNFVYMTLSTGIGGGAFIMAQRNVNIQYLLLHRSDCRAFSGSGADVCICEYQLQPSALPVSCGRFYLSCSRHKCDFLAARARKKAPEEHRRHGQHLLSTDNGKDTLFPELCDTYHLIEEEQWDLKACAAD